MAEDPEVPTVGSVNDEETGPISFESLGIPTGPKLENTALGKARSLWDIEKKEIAFLVVSGVSLLATIVFTIYKLATIGYGETDFTFALVLLLNALFCMFYIVHGIVKERPYEIFILVLGTFLIVLYLILNYAIGNKGTVKLIRMIAGICLGPVVIGLGAWIGWEFHQSGNLIFRTVGASPVLQSMCRMMFLFFDLLKLDLQLGASMVIFILSGGTNVDTEDIVILVVGGVITIVWFILGHWSVSREDKIGTYIFLGASPLEIGYIIYKTVKSAGNIANSPALGAITITCGVLAFATRVSIIILTCIVYRNYGKGLKEKAYGTG